MADQYLYRFQLEKWHEDGSATITVFNERDVLISSSRLNFKSFDAPTGTLNLVCIHPEDGVDGIDVYVSPVPSAVLAVLIR